MAFIDGYLPLPTTPKPDIVLGFDTMVLLNSGYQEQRYPRLSEYLATIDLSDATFRDTELDAFITFFEGLQGKLNTFRYQIPCDCYAQSKQLGIDRDLSDHTSVTGIVRSYGVAIPVDSDRQIVTAGTSTLWQLAKIYEFDDGANTHIGIKTVTKPVNNTVIVWDDSNTQLVSGAGFTIDTTTGIVTTTIGYVATGYLNAQFQFDLEVRLDVDEVPQILLVSGANSGGAWSYQTCQRFQFSSLPLVEVADYKLPKIPALYTKFGASLPNTGITTLTLDYEHKPIETIAHSYQTRLEQTINRFENRLSYTQDNRFSIAFEGTTVTNAPIRENKTLPSRLHVCEYLVALFNICVGRLRNLNIRTFYQNTSQTTRFVRFNTDELSLKTLVESEGCATFEVGELEFIETRSAEIVGLNTSCMIGAIDNTPVGGGTPPGGGGSGDVGQATDTSPLPATCVLSRITGVNANAVPSGRFAHFNFANGGLVNGGASNNPNKDYELMNGLNGHDADVPFDFNVRPQLMGNGSLDLTQASNAPLLWEGMYPSLNAGTDNNPAFGLSFDDNVAGTIRQLADSIGGGFSVSTWVLLDNVDGTPYDGGTVVSDGNDMFALEVTKNGVSFQVSDNGGTFNSTSVSIANCNPVDTNYWIHAVGTYEVTGDNASNLQVYVNLVKHAVTSDTQGTIASSEKIIVGGTLGNVLYDNFGFQITSAQRIQGFRGYIHHISFYDRALTDDDVVTLYNDGAGRI